MLIARHFKDGVFTGRSTTFSHVISNKVIINQFSAHDCNLSYALFKNVNLSHCEMIESNFNYATFDNCDLDQANFQGAALSAATFNVISGALSSLKCDNPTQFSSACFSKIFSR